MSTNLQFSPDAPIYHTSFQIYRPDYYGMRAAAVFQMGRISSSCALSRLLHRQVKRYCSALWRGPSTYKDITVSPRYNSLRCALEPLKAELFPDGNMSLDLLRIFKAFSKLRHSLYRVPVMRVEVHSFLRGPEGHTFFAECIRFYQPL